MGRMISTPEACAILNARHPLLYQARKEGRLTAFFLDNEEEVPAEGGGKGHAVRWDEDEILRFAATRDQIPAAPSREAWLPQAACRRLPPKEAAAVFFPDHPESSDQRFVPATPEQYEEGRKMCFSCPVRLQCLRWAVRSSNEEGMFGGALPVQLKKMGRLWRRDRMLPSICGWCGEAFSPVGEERYCRQSCGKAGLAAGGVDLKNRRVSA